MNHSATSTILPHPLAKTKINCYICETPYKLHNLAPSFMKRISIICATIVVVGLFLTGCTNRQQKTSAASDCEKPDEMAIEQVEQSHQTATEEIEPAEQKASIYQNSPTLISQEEYAELTAAATPKPVNSQSQRKKKSAPKRRGCDFGLVDFLSNPYNREKYDQDSSLPILLGLYGDVESVTLSTFNITKEDSLFYKRPCEEDKLICELNKQGNFTKIIETYPTNIEYDHRGRIVKEGVKYDALDRVTKGKGGTFSDNVAYLYLPSDYIGIKPGFYNNKIYTIYDKHGRVVEVINDAYHENAGGAFSHSYCKYDATGNLVRVRMGARIPDFPDGEGESFGVWNESLYEYRYDRYNRLISIDSYCITFGGMEIDSSHYTFQYDAIGNLILLTRSQGHSDYYSISENISYKNSVITLIKNAYKNRKLTGKSAFKYDSKGNVVQKINYDENNTPTSITEFNIVYRK